ncbi:T9SS type A sorting domain-containing protein [Bernardetia sp. Wsw4-3y2]|uniref:DUF7619 domain-containing protein n=1 Tax=Bernardetia sp. Wsw4-3y2 TaxID=3127471 RepID=UPI0030CB5C87
MTKSYSNLHSLLFVCAVFLLSNFYSFSAFGQCNPAVSDPSFNSLDEGYGNGDVGINLRRIIPLPNGNTYLAGVIHRYNNQIKEGIILLNQDGKLDNSFRAFLPNNYYTASIEDAELQSDGKLLVIGHIIERPNVQKQIVRLNTDGSTDYSFEVTGLDNTSTITEIALQSTGKVIVMGNLQVNGIAKKLVRLNNNGSIDNSFTQGNVVSSAAYAIQDVKVQSDNKILCVGDFSSYNGVARKGIVRLDTDGSVDVTYNVAAGGVESNGTYSPVIYNIELQADGKAIIVGNFSGYNGTNRGRIARINADGTLDINFDSSIGFEGGKVNNTDIQADGKVVVVGFFNSYKNAFRRHIIRLNADGSIDNSFVEIYSKNAVNPRVKILSDGKILTNTRFTSTELARLNSDGSWDETYNRSYGANDGLDQIVRLPNNKMFLFGNQQFGRYDNQVVNAITKINEDGSRDTTFSFVETSLSQLPSVPPNHYIKVIAAQSEKLLVAGSFSTTSLTTRTKIVRLNEDGSRDFSFDATSVFPLSSFSEITQMKVQSDNKILVGGYDIDAPNTYGLIRLNPDGTRDNSFTWLGIDNAGNIAEILIQNDGKIVLSGYFTNYGGSSVGNFMRLLPSGNLDTTFTPNFTLTSLINTINELANGDIIISGRFNSTAFPNNSLTRVLKINNQGIIYPSIDITLEANARINKILPQTDGKITIVGKFNQLQGNPIRNVGRVNENGSADIAFNTTTGTDTTIVDAVILPNSIVIVGDFLEYNGVGRNRIAKITNQTPIITNVTPPNQQTGVCINSTTNLIATGLGDIHWYNSPTNPVPIHIGDTLTTSAITADSTYFYAKDSVAGCGNSDRIAILITLGDSAYINTQNITVYLDSLGTVNVNAFQIDSLSRVGCGDTIVSYTFRDTGLETRSYSCADTSVMHEVWLQITDNNGNIDTAQAFIQVRDTIAPVVRTQPFAVALATNTSVVTVSALDLIYSLSDNCTDSANITVVFANTGLITQSFSCGNFSNSNLRVTDRSGNSVIVPTTIILTGHDLDVSFTSGGFRPAVHSYVQLQGFNRTCAPVSGQVQVILDNLTEYSTIYNFNPPSSIVGNTLTWNFSNLSEALPRFRSGFYVNTDISANIGDSVCFTVRITPTNGDINLANNTKTYCFPIINSYDPNDKQVYPQGICDDKFTKRSDLPLTYTIRFQNTGNAPALNVNIVDSLSSLLDRSSLRIVGSSHPMVVDTTANNNNINFLFDNINLPDSTSSPELSQGYVIFELDEIAAHTDTSRIENKSYIYFDTNAPIITNTVKNTILDVLPLCDPAGGSNPPIADCQLPTNLTAEALSATRVKLSWATPANSNAINYEIWRNNQLLETIVSSQLSFVDSLVSSSTQYTYSIKAICGNNTATSNFVQVRTIPSTPTLFSLEAACKGETGTIEVRSNGAVYRIYASQDATTPLFETDNATIQTPALNDTTTFYISVIINSLESERLEVVVPIKEVFEAIVEQGSLFETCSNTFTLSANEVENASYLWFRDNIQVGNTRALVVSFEGNYTVRISKEGCFAVSEATKVVFVDAPTAKIEQGSEVPFCGNGMLNAQDTSSNVTYTWSLNGTDIGTGTSISVSESGNYTLTASQPSCLDSVSIAVTITDLPAMVLSADKTEICSSEETRLSVTTSTGFTYKWFRNDTAISNDSSTLVTFEIGTYKVEITTTEGCQVESNEIEITEAQAQNATITINKENSFDKTISVSSSDSIVSVIWFKDGNEVASFNNQKTIEPTESGSYKAKITYLAGCEFETEEKVFTFDIATGIEEESAKIFTVYPNPNNGSFKVEFATTTNQKTNLVLVDALGRTIYSKEISRNEKTTTITLSKISAGVYIVQIISQGKVYTKQLVIQ